MEIIREEVPLRSEELRCHTSFDYVECGSLYELAGIKASLQMLECRHFSGKKRRLRAL